MRKKLSSEVVEQYRVVQRKIDAQKAAGVSNEQFLRTSNVRVVVDPDIEKYFDQVVDLLNSASDVDYTKQRLATEKDIETLRKDLGEFGFHAGCVFAKDNHGDYGFVGFYLLHHIAKVKRLVHFTFSCRAMHMGIEQYVYELLGRPEIKIADPVSYGLQTHEKIDWINQEGGASGSGVASNQNLVLLGGCDLLQLSSYCSVNRQEFVSKVKDGVKIRYDDPGFILNDRETIKASAALRKIPFWTYEDAASFDAAVKAADIIILSLWPAARGDYFRTHDQLLLHINKQTQKQIKDYKPGWLKRQVVDLDYKLPERLKLIAESLDKVGEVCSPEARIFVLGFHTFDNVEGDLLKQRTAYNEACRDYCANRGSKFVFVDVNKIVPQETLIDQAHFTRLGYFALAKFIMQAVSNPEKSAALHAA
ncbi:MAG TPA: hypothetical protein VGK90_11730 [Rhizomicrobium sp.]|jgi:hypothetical protein